MLPQHVIARRTCNRIEACYNSRVLGDRCQVVDTQAMRIARNRNLMERHYRSGRWLATRQRLPTLHVSAYSGEQRWKGAGRLRRQDRGTRLNKPS